jgi:hypothetical protein
VALASDYNSTWEGPGNENTIATLANSSLLCVMRMKFDTNYMTTRSDDQGLRWTKAVEMTDASGWERHSLSYWHNELAPAGMPVYTESVNCTKGGVKQAKCSDDETLGYTR